MDKETKAFWKIIYFPYYNLYSHRGGLNLASFEWNTEIRVSKYLLLSNAKDIFFLQPHLRAFLKLINFFLLSGHPMWNKLKIFISDSFKLFHKE